MFRVSYLDFRVPCHTMNFKSTKMKILRQSSREAPEYRINLIKAGNSLTFALNLGRQNESIASLDDLRCHMSCFCVCVNFIIVRERLRGD